MKTSKHSNYNHNQDQGAGAGRLTKSKVDHQDSEQSLEEVEEIKRRIYVGGRLASVVIGRVPN